MSFFRDFKKELSEQYERSQNESEYDDLVEGEIDIDDSNVDADKSDVKGSRTRSEIKSAMMTGKEKCEMLKSIRKQIAEANNIVYMEPECHHEGDCAGTCPKCDAQIRYLDAEINRKIENGEKITISGLSVEPFEKIVGKTTDKKVTGNNLVNHGDAVIYDEDGNEQCSDDDDMGELVVDELDISCGVMKDPEIDHFGNASEDHLDVDKLDSVVCGVNEMCDPEEENSRLDNMNIDELELSVRSYNCLRRAGIKTVGDLRGKTSEDMMKVRNLGRKSLEEVKAKMKELGIEVTWSESYQVR